ncbi:MAG: hypothetical protein ACREE3_12345 [Stellaceae bacterium]
MRRDRRVLWCAEGIVHEYVPSARTELRYGLGRRLRQSQLYIQTFFWGDRPDRCAIAKWMVVGVMQMLAYAPLSLIFWPIDRPRAKRFLALVYGGLGKVFWTPRFMAIAYGRRAAAVE